MRKSLLIIIFSILMAVALSLVMIFDDYIFLTVVLIIAMMGIFLANHDAAIAITLFLIPFSWGFISVGIGDLFDQRLSYLLFYMLFLSTLIHVVTHERKYPVRGNLLFVPLLLFLMVNSFSVAISADIVWGVKESHQTIISFGSISRGLQLRPR